MRKILLAIISSVVVGLAAFGVAAADSPNFWKPVGNYLQPILPNYGIKTPSGFQVDQNGNTITNNLTVTGICTGCSAAVTWGQIGGSLSNHSDLQNALDSKLSTTTAAATYYLQSNPAGYITSSALSPYLTSANAASTYYLQTNPAGYITSAALSPYLTSASAASTYYLQSNPAGYITSSALTPYLSTTSAASLYQPIGNYLTGVTANAPLSGNGTAGSPLTFTNPGYITGIAWGQITGTLSGQTDLQNALNAKLSTTTAAATYQPIGSYLTSESDPLWIAQKAGYLTTTTAASTYYLQSNPSNFITSAALTPYLSTTSAASTYQPILVSGTSIKTVNSTSMLGSGDVAVQPTLVSGTNIKTINGNTLLGSGDLVITGTGGGLASTSPFTAGYVQYATTTGALTDSPIAISSGRVGIGNSNPQYALDVVGSVAFGGSGKGKLVIDNSYYNNNVTISNVAGGSDGHIYIKPASGVTDFVAPINVNNQFILENSGTANSARFYAYAGTSNADFIFNTGNYFGTAGGDIKFMPGVRQSDYTTRFGNFNIIISPSGTGSVQIPTGNLGIGTTSPRAKLEINSNSFILSTAQTPATSTSTCTTGMIAWDTGYVYVCTATNSWKRSALSSW